MTSMGMDKSGTQTLPVSTWTKITGWTVRSGYPSTSIVNNCLVMDQVSTGNIRFRGNFSISGTTQQFRVVKNGVTVLGSAVNLATIGNISAVSMVPGDTLELQGFGSTSTSFTVVQAGAAQTFLEWNQTTSNQNIDGGRTVNWDRTAALGLGGPIGGARSWDWATTGAMSRGGPIQATRSWVWDTTANLYKGQFYDIEADRPWDWGISADLLHIQPAKDLNVSFDDVAVSIHTVDGRGVVDFTCHMINGITWGREQRQVSPCQILLATQGDEEGINSVFPLLHWATIWHAGKAMWRGMIQQVAIGSVQTTIELRDTSTLMWRTRVPITKTWADTDPTGIADSMLRSMLDLHRFQTKPVVLPGITEAFTYHADADLRMVNQMMDDLVKLGLQWTVVGGQFILGEFDAQPFAELNECDFLVEITKLRDGTGTFNDVRLQGQNYAQTAVAPLAGLRMQTLVSLDDVYGVSNIQKATQRYAAETAQIRDMLVIPGSATLHPDAPVSLAELIPGRVIKVNASGVTTLMKIDQMQFSITPDEYSTQVTLIAVQTQTELAELLSGGTGGGGAT